MLVHINPGNIAQSTTPPPSYDNTTVIHLNTKSIQTDNSPKVHRPSPSTRRWFGPSGIILDRKVPILESALLPTAELTHGNDENYKKKTFVSKDRHYSMDAHSLYHSRDTKKTANHGIPPPYPSHPNPKPNKMLLHFPKRIQSFFAKSIHLYANIYTTSSNLHTNHHYYVTRTSRFRCLISSSRALTTQGKQTEIAQRYPRTPLFSVCLIFIHHSGMTPWKFENPIKPRMNA